METHVCEIERMGLYDGPGIRTVVFLKGCPLRCLWCSNPETQLTKNQIYYDEKKCIKCKKCTEVSENNAVTFTEKWEFDPEKCEDVQSYISVCPTGALRETAKKMTTEEVFREVMKDTSYYKNSKGGLTVSGGEVLMNTDFAAELLSMVKEEYISTAIETTGFGKYENLEKLAKVTDHVLFDLKHMDSKIHKEITGVSNEIILENLEKLSRWHKGIIIRFPLIKGMNDTEENVIETAKFLKKVKLNEIHVLPYHTLGLGKYKQLQMKYPMKILEKHTKEELERVLELIREVGINGKLNG